MPKIYEDYELLLDNNVIIDALRGRTPYNAGADLLLALGRVHEFELWLSPTQLGDMFYALAKGRKSQAELVKTEVKAALECVCVCPYNADDVQECLNSDWDDLEDALVYQAARSIGAEVIITRNQKGFKCSTIPVFDCDEFFAWLRDSKGANYDYIEL